MTHEGYMNADEIAHMSNGELLDEIVSIKRNCDSGIADSDKVKAEIARRMDCEWGVFIVDGPAADTWCQHTEGHRIETNERTAKTIAILFRERASDVRYEARRLPR